MSAYFLKIKKEKFQIENFKLISDQVLNFFINRADTAFLVKRSSGTL